MIGEVLNVESGEHNQHDDYTVAVMKNGDILGHARSISRVSWLFSETWRSYNVSDCASHVNDPTLIQDPAFISEQSMLTPGL